MRDHLSTPPEPADRRDERRLGGPGRRASDAVREQSEHERERARAEHGRSRESPANGEPSVGTRLSAAEIHDNVKEAAKEEMRRPADELAWSALGAGLTMGFSFVAAAYLASLAPEHLKHAASAAGYPLGFIFVVLARSQLFTENTLDPVIPLLHERSMRMLRRTLRLWAIVLAGNMVGAVIFGVVAARTVMLPETLRASLHTVATTSTEGGFWLVAYKAIFGGWLVALMAWLIASTRLTGAQIALVWLTTAPIAAFGFRHSIAGAVEAFYLAAAGSATWGAMVGAFIVPAVLGNVVGGVTLVALLNHGQVGPERERKDWRWMSGAER
ncbi:MAG TPA: formate/nitrite transporter family protein [Gemmatimonadaceae bacterium]|nr:formate/nitrite transporter family protein [Gemmatimonadaceae bacterium]